MKDVQLGRTTVKGGLVTQDVEKKLEQMYDSHNFVNRIDVVVKKAELESAGADYMKSITCEGIEFMANLFQLLKYILAFEPIERQYFKLISTDTDIMDENSICIHRGKLTLKLKKESYLKSGFQFKLSTASRGNRNVVSQMYIHTFDLVNFEENIKKNIQNYVRLLWFAENIDSKNYVYNLTCESDGFDYQNSILTLENMNIEAQLKKATITTKIMIDCVFPNLDIVQNEEQLQDIAEWITLSSIGGTVQQYRDVDPYISSYFARIDAKDSVDLAVMTMEETLITSALHAKIMQHLINNFSWFAFGSYGVKNATKAYENSGEHIFADDGSNDILLFFSEGSYAVWDTTDGGDPHIL